MTMLDRDEVPKAICASASQALSQYHRSSGEPLDDMPEYFVQSIVADRLGEVLTFTLETSFWKLFRFVNRQSEEHLSSSMRFDTIVYDHYVGRARDVADLLGVIEVKKGYSVTRVASDIQKLKAIFFPLGFSQAFGAVLFYFLPSRLRLLKPTQGRPVTNGS
jgi:hypothetical protein